MIRILVSYIYIKEVIEIRTTALHFTNVVGMNKSIDDQGLKLGI